MLKFDISSQKCCLVKPRKKLDTKTFIDSRSGGTRISNDMCHIKSKSMVMLCHYRYCMPLPFKLMRCSHDMLLEIAVYFHT